MRVSFHCETDNTNLSTLRNVIGADFEAVDVSSLMIDPNSGQAKQTSVSVTVTPSSASVLTGQQQQFTATVQNSTDQSVTWSVNRKLGGDATVGTIDTLGGYTAPATVPSPATVTVTATSVSTPAAFGSASVTITAPVPVSVTVSPATATVRVNRSRQFTATAQGTSNLSVTWSTTAGSITSSGLYTAPNTVPSPNTAKVIATSVADPSKSGSATVTITGK